MKSVLKAVAILLILMAAAAAGGIWYLTRTGLSAIEPPGRVETAVAGRIRNFVIAREARELKNPVEHSEEAIADGRAHFADHCAICHANDGSGDTAIGRGLYPRPPDMRLARTQDLSDGELFWIVQNGIRFTGMPGWRTGTQEGELSSWRLVHFIRRLPRLTAEEIEAMEALNPRPPEEIRQQIMEEQFLKGGEPPGAAPATPHKHPGGHR